MGKNRHTCTYRPQLFGLHCHKTIRLYSGDQFDYFMLSGPEVIKPLSILSSSNYEISTPNEN